MVNAVAKTEAAGKMWQKCGFFKTQEKAGKFRLFQQKAGKEKTSSNLLITTGILRLKMVEHRRLELLTPTLPVWCSSQLS